MRLQRSLVSGVAAAALLTVTVGFANAATLVSQATAQGVNAQVPALTLGVALSATPTTATNDGTGSNAEVDAAPIVNLPLTQKFITVGAVQEAVEASTAGSSYACSGTAQNNGQIQVGNNASVCSSSVPLTATNPGVVIDLGQLPGLGSLATTAGGDIKILIGAVTASGQLTGNGPATLQGNVAGIYVTLGTGAPIQVAQSSNAVNGDLLGQVLGALFPSGLGGGLSPIGTAVSTLLTPLISLTTNYQPAPEPNASGIYSATGLHIALLGTIGGTATGTIDLAHVTLGPNAVVAPVSAFSFGELPIVLGGIAVLLLIALGGRQIARRVRAGA
jgi:hypothetical protein